MDRDRAHTEYWLRRASRIRQRALQWQFAFERLGLREVEANARGAWRLSDRLLLSQERMLRVRERMMAHARDYEARAVCREGV